MSNNSKLAEKNDDLQMVFNYSIWIKRHISHGVPNDLFGPSGFWSMTNLLNSLQDRLVSVLDYANRREAKK